MKIRWLTIGVSVFGFLPYGWALENPVGPSTVPPSSLGGGTINTPNPINPSSNLSVTGNIGGGRYFRGSLPYGSGSNFGTTLGSTSLDAFLRDSAGSETFGGFSGRPQSFYSRTGTVSTSTVGASGAIFRSSAGRISGRVTDRIGLPARSIATDSRTSDLTRTSPVFRPTRFGSDQLEKLIADGVVSEAQANRLFNPQDVGQRDRLQRDLMQLNHRAPSLRESLILRDQSLRPFSKFERSAQLKLEPPSWQTPQKQDDTDAESDLLKDPASDILPSDIYQMMKKQVKKFQEEAAAASPESREKGEQDRSSDEKWSKRDSDSPRSTKTKGGLATFSTEIKFEAEQRSSILEGLSDTHKSARAKTIMGKHKTFASFSNDKFNNHLRAAETYMKEGRFYKAASSYKLASIYKLDDPLPYAGRSHALFAAGEYVSSALYLLRAMEIFPEYARLKIDLEAMIGDRDTLESRILDVELWQEKTNSAELQFLLSYVYYQIGRLDRAKEAIDAAHRKKPDQPAIKALKEAIDSHLAITR